MRRRLPPLTALRAFEAAGRLGRMTLAAEELHVTHSAVSRQVRHLEAALGVTLFEGPKTALRLSEAGRRLLPGLTAAFDGLESAVRQVADTEQGPLDVSCLGTLTLRWLIPRLHRFQAASPGIEVRLTSSDAPVDFARDGCDVAIRVGRAPWPEEVEVTPLFPETFGPVMAPRWQQDPGGPPEGRAPKTPLPKTPSPAVCLPEELPRLRTRTRPEAWSAWAARAGSQAASEAAPETGAAYEHFYFLLEAVTAGLGACVAPWVLVADDLRAGRLVAPFGFIDSGLTYVALRRRRRHRKAARFVAWLEAEARATPQPRSPSQQSRPQYR
ncbi:LysR family transcriptional regulator [Phormidium willei BDU 130791]|nr:LysR family transcriptional regulator [Phormidium willei BDU 130791]